MKWCSHGFLERNCPRCANKLLQKHIAELEAERRDGLLREDAERTTIIRLNDRITELEADLAKANRGYEIEKDVADKHFSDLTEARADIEQRDEKIVELEAENKRLRNALAQHLSPTEIWYSIDVDAEIIGKQEELSKIPAKKTGLETEQGS
jgi:DNA repair exonuclease SbcCD ATPase subunit